MTVGELQRLGAEILPGTEVVVEIAATGSELRGPFVAVVDDDLIVEASPGMAMVPADQIKALVLVSTSPGPE